MHRWLQRLVNAAFLIGGGALLQAGTGRGGGPDQVFLGVFLIVVGLVLMPDGEASARRPLQSLGRRRERALLRLARDRDGRFTSPEVALELGLPLAEAKALLDALVLHGYAVYAIEDGQVVYRMRMRPAADKPSLRERLHSLRESHPSLAEREQQLVRLALQQGGKISAPEVTARLGLSLDEAKRWLDSLVARGHLGCEVTEDGRLVYRLIEMDDPQRLTGREETAETVVMVGRHGDD